MLHLSQIPDWLQSGEIYRNLVSDNSDEDPIMIRPLKTDLEFSTLRDVLEHLDTALYMGIDKLPPDVYRFCCLNPQLLIEMNRLSCNEGDLVNYQHFTTIPEYTAFRICAESDTSVQSINDYFLYQEAFKHNNMPLLRYCTEDCGGCTMDTFSASVEYGRIDFCKYILDKYPDWIGPIKSSWGHIDTAASKGDIQMMAYLTKTIGIRWCERIIHNAMNHQHFECAIYAIKNGCPIPKYAADVAVQYNNIAILSLLIDMGAAVDRSYTLNYALQMGYIDIAKMLYANGARPNSNTMVFECGNEECRLFAIEIIHKM